MNPYETKDRSQLNKLTKSEVVDGIVDHSAFVSYARAQKILRPLSKRADRLIEHADVYIEEIKSALLKLPKVELVRISYAISDWSLNMRYYKAPKHETVNPNTSRRDVLKRSFTLARERPIDSDSLKDKKLWRKSNKPLPAQLIPKKAVQKRKKIKAIDWVAAMRKHNAFMAADVVLNTGDDLRS